MFPITTKPAPKRIKYQIPHPLAADRDYALLWYGGIKSGRGSDEVPYVAVFFKELSGGVLCGRWILKWAKATLLGQMRIGSIWRNGFSDRNIVFKQHHYVGMYSLEQWDDTISAGNVSIAAHGYELPYERERSRLLQLRSRSGILYVPCLEFFTRCYARDAEVNRALLTYNADEIKERLLLESPIESVMGAWPVWVPPRVPFADARLLAHLRHDDAAWNKVKRINAELDHQLRGKNLPYAFIPIGPWHFGPSQLKVEGIPLAKGDFLGLRIVGQTLPDTPIYAQYEIGSPHNGGEIGTYPRPQRRTHEVQEDSPVTVNEHQAPDTNTDFYFAHDPKMEILNFVPPITKKAVQKPPHRPTIRIPSESSDGAASSEAAGNSKGVGTLIVQSDAVLLSEGSIRDLWNGLLAVQQANPSIIQSLCWYHPQHAFHEMQVQAYTQLPQLQSESESLDDTEESESVKKEMREISAWLNRSHLPGPRGACIIQVVTPSITGYLFEVQRAKKFEMDGKQAEGNESVTELENYCGLAVVPLKGAEFHSWLNTVLTAISMAKGVMSKVLGQIEIQYGDDYKRTAKRTDPTPWITTAMNALRKLRIQGLAEPPREKKTADQ